MLKHIIHGKTEIHFTDTESWLVVDEKGNVELHQVNEADEELGLKSNVEEMDVVSEGIMIA